MSIPESIPEDKKESYPCDYCSSGTVTKDDYGSWFCNDCDFEVEGYEVLNEKRLKV